MNDEEETMHIVDDTRVFTKSEILELKRIAQVSKLSKYIIGVITALFTLFVIPQVISWAQAHIKIT